MPAQPNLVRLIWPRGNAFLPDQSKALHARWLRHADPKSGFACARPALPIQIDSATWFPIVAGSESRLGTLGGSVLKSHNLGVAYVPIIKTAHLIRAARQAWTAVLSLIFVTHGGPPLLAQTLDWARFCPTPPLLSLPTLRYASLPHSSYFALTVVQSAAANGTKPKQSNHTRASSHSLYELELWGNTKAATFEPTSGTGLAGN